MRARLCMLVAVAAALAAAAPALGSTPPPSRDDVDPAILDGSAQRELEAARERWRATGLRSYRFRARLQCFCAPSAREPAVIVVRHGRPVDPPDRLRDVATVPRLLRAVQRAIDERVAGLSVRYGRRGVPRSIWIDGSRMIADEEVGYVVERFRAPRPAHPRASLPPARGTEGPPARPLPPASTSRHLTQLAR